MATFIEDDDRSRKAPKDSAAVLRKVLAKLGGGIDDPTNEITFRAPETGEQRLAYEMIVLALQDAQESLCVLCEAERDCKGSRCRRGKIARSSARSWLQDASALLSARVCFESLGIDYEVAREAMRKQWRAKVKVQLPRKVFAGSARRVCSNQ